MQSGEGFIAKMQRVAVFKLLCCAADEAQLGCGGARLRVLGKAGSIPELADLVIRERDGALVRLRDVAQVDDGEQEPQTAARRARP